VVFVQFPGFWKLEHERHANGLVLVRPGSGRNHLLPTGLVGLRHRISEMLTGKPGSLELIGKVTDRNGDSSRATWRLSARISRSMVEGKGLPRSWHGRSFEKASDPA
jgi:hypothetical protein